MADKFLTVPDLSIEDEVVTQGSPIGKSLDRSLNQPIKADAPESPEGQEKSEDAWKEAIRSSKEQTTEEVPPITETVSTPSIPEKNDAGSPKKLGPADVSEIVQILLSDTVEIEKALVDAGLTTKILKECMEKEEVEPWIAKLLLGWRLQSKQFNLMNDSLSRLVELQESLAPADSVTHLKDRLHKGMKQSKDNRSTPLTGKKAVMAAIGKTQGLRKIYLHNSGFFVVLRPLSMQKLGQFYNTVDKDQQELGRIIGDFSFMVADIKLKESFMQLMEEEAIVASNLKDYDTPGTITRNLSFHDYDTLLWGACCSLFPRGMEIGLPCVAADCKYVESKIDIDLTKLRMVAYSKMPEDAQLALGGGGVTEEEVQKYQKELLGFTGMHEQDGVRYHLKVPTMSEYLQNGNRVFNTIVFEVQGKPLVKNKVINDRVIINVYKTLKPWISSLESLDEDGNIEFIIEQSEDALYELLDPLVQEQYGGAIYTTVQNFIHDTKLTHICYSGLKCPKCGKQPQGKYEDYIPLDMQMHFFSLAYHLLILGGLGM